MNGLPQAERKMMAAGISGPEGHAMAHPEVPLQPDDADQDLLDDDGYEEDHDHDHNLSHHRKQRQKLLCEHVSLPTRFISTFIIIITTITITFIIITCHYHHHGNHHLCSITRLGVRCTCLV